MFPHMHISTRCRDTDVFEWYGKYERFSSIIKEYIVPDNKILNIGCGTARKLVRLFGKYA